MGLDTTHDAWSGGYISFNQWRTTVAELAGLPPYNSMEGCFGDISWEPYKNNPLFPLLYHSDCDGEIEWDKCGLIADSLEKLMAMTLHPSFDEDFAFKTKKFIEGARLAYSLRENIEFN